MVSGSLLRLFMQGIHVTAYSPLGTPDSASMMKRADDTPSLLHEEAVKKVADKLGKAPAQVRLPPLSLCSCTLLIQVSFEGAKLCASFLADLVEKNTLLTVGCNPLLEF